MNESSRKIFLFGNFRTSSIVQSILLKSHFDVWDVMQIAKIYLQSLWLFVFLSSNE